MGVDGVQVRIVADGDDAGELAELVGRLGAELGELDVDRVDAAADPAPPGDAKGVGLLAGALFVKFGGLGTLKAVLSAVAAWASRNRREVEVTLGGDTLKVTGLDPAAQEKIIDAWIARHPVA